MPGPKKCLQRQRPGVHMLWGTNSHQRRSLGTCFQEAKSQRAVSTRTREGGDAVVTRRTALVNAASIRVQIWLPPKDMSGQGRRGGAGCRAPHLASHMPTAGNALPSSASVTFCATQPPWLFHSASPFDQAPSDHKLCSISLPLMFPPGSDCRQVFCKHAWTLLIILSGSSTEMLSGSGTRLQTLPRSTVPSSSWTRAASASPYLLQVSHILPNPTSAPQKTGASWLSPSSQLPPPPASETDTEVTGILQVQAPCKANPTGVCGIFGMQGPSSRVRFCRCPLGICSGQD